VNQNKLISTTRDNFMLFVLVVLKSIYHEVDKCHLRSTFRRQTRRP